MLVTIVLGWGIGWMLWPMLARWDTYGFHDWDLAASHRYVTRVGLREYGELPLWNPWVCGGFPGFGFIEGASNLISPYLLFYLLLDMRSALRIEALGATVLAAVGAFWFAGRFTRSVALAAVGAALFSLNGRWALQLATGHSWHLQFCWLPWTLYAFDRAQCTGRAGSAILAGGFMALMAFMGGVYPLPHTALCLTGYAIVLAVERRSSRPLVTLAVAGAVAAGLSAPKLLLAVDTMAHAPRLTAPSEGIGITELAVMLTARGQRFGQSPVTVPQHGWHEWGIYIGTIPLCGLVLGALLARGPRERALKVTGFGMMLLGFGAFCPNAPWALLHRLPVFSSCHAPSRILIVMVLMWATAFVAWAATPVDRLLRRAPWFDLVLLIPVAILVDDLGSQSQSSLRQAFWMEAPRTIEVARQFEHHKHAITKYTRGDGQTPVYLPMIANQGVIDCYGVPASYAFGALAVEEQEYRGMAELIGDKGRATITEWSPNRAVVRVEEAKEGALIVYNMNYDPSWRANGRAAVDYQHRVATRLRAGEAQIIFRYLPKRLGPGVAVSLGTLIAILAWLNRNRLLVQWRRDKRTQPTTRCQDVDHG